MTNVELIEGMAKTILDKEGLSLNELDELMNKAETPEDRMLYADIFNYLLSKRQQEVIANEHY